MFRFRLDGSSGVPPYLQLVHQVRQSLLLGYLREGDRLPTVKDVAADLVINPNTVVKAYRQLEHEGLAGGRPGQGTFITATAPPAVPQAQAALRESLEAWLRAAREAGLDDEAVTALIAVVLPGLHVRVGVPPSRMNHTGTSEAIDDRIRTSDADRERATARLRDHFAEGRLTREELDERVMAALNARTTGDLRRAMADLPEPAPAPQQARTLPPAAKPRTGVGWGGPLILPLVALVLGVLLIAGGRWPFFAFLQVALAAALIVRPAAIVAAARFRRRMRRY